MRNDEATKGFALASMIAIALNEPESVLPRQKVRGNKAEPIKSWQTRAVWQTLEEHGIDPHRTFRSEEDREHAERHDPALRVTRPSCAPGGGGA